MYTWYIYYNKHIYILPVFPYHLNHVYRSTVNHIYLFKKWKIIQAILYSRCPQFSCRLEGKGPSDIFKRDISKYPEDCCPKPNCNERWCDYVKLKFFYLLSIWLKNFFFLTTKLLFHIILLFIFNKNMHITLFLLLVLFFLLNKLKI